VAIAGADGQRFELVARRSERPGRPNRPKPKRLKWSKSIWRRKSRATIHRQAEAKKAEMVEEGRKAEI